MTSPKKLAFAIIEHLWSQHESGAVSGDSAESLEVAVQCLEQIYGIDRSDPSQRKQLGTEQTLQEIFNNATKTTGGSTSAQPTTDLRPKEADKTVTAVSLEVKAEAEKLKVEGNQLMKEEKYEEAVECYTKAMEMDPSNAVFPCNRAAAYSKMGDHSKAVEDCKRAITIDPGYGKAYGRLGLSYQSMNELAKAKENYVKAVELEPGNTFYQNNLAQVEARLKENMQSQQNAGGIPRAGSGGGGAPNAGGLDFMSLLGNPAVMNMAQTFMTNPQVQQMMSGIMSGAGGAGPGAGGLGGIFQAAQQFGDQMQQTNPELFNQMRGQAEEAFGSTSNSSQSQEEEKKTDDGSDPN